MGRDDIVKRVFSDQKGDSESCRESQIRAIPLKLKVDGRFFYRNNAILTMAKNENTRMPAKINAFTAIIGTARGDSSFAILCLRLGLSFEPSFFAASI